MMLIGRLETVWRLRSDAYERRKLQLHSSAGREGRGKALSYIPEKIFTSVLELSEARKAELGA